MQQPHFFSLEKRIVYVVSHSYPHTSNGYAVRTHGIASAMQQQGYDLVSINRPGRPWDLPGFDGAGYQLEHCVDGLRYICLPSPSKKTTKNVEQWQQQAISALEEAFRVYKPEVVLAASNWENAIPALHAAKNLGIPFAYEVRGFWEVTRASRFPEWFNSAEFNKHVEQETYVAKHAQRVFTLNPFMRDELVKRGVNPDVIHIVPNGFNAKNLPQLGTESPPLLKGIKNKFTVGYIGSFSEYEGLDDLLEACAKLKGNGIDVALLLVGSSSAIDSDMHKKQCPITEKLQTRARELGYANNLFMPGRISPKQLAAYYDALDLFVIPRKDLPVCELVSPIKPLEAAAFGKAILASSVAPLAEFVEGAGIALFEKGNVADLQKQLEMLLRSPKKRNEMGKKAQLWVERERSFEKVITPMLEQLAQIKHLPVLRWSQSLEGKSKRAVEGAKLSTVNPVCNITPIGLAKGKNSLTEAEKLLLDRKLNHALENGGVAWVEQLVELQSAGKSTKFTAFCYQKAATVVLNASFVSESVAFAERAHQLDASAGTLRGVVRVLSNAAQVERSAELAKLLSSKLTKPTVNDKKFIDEVLGRAELVRLASAPAQPCLFTPIANKVLNLLAFSLPYTSVGYATRSHGLARGIINAGWHVAAYTRPGFPVDFKPELEGQILPEEDRVEGISYKRLLDIKRNELTEVEYLFASIAHYERVIELEQPAIVHAASNYVTALPALIAARRKGIPFVYEVRGFWEVTRSSRDEQFVNTAKYRYMQLFEALVACKADKVITITTAMKEQLIERGVAADNIAIAFNSVDPERFLPQAPKRELAERLGIPAGIPVIGYIGSFVDYEGLDDLISAAAGLRDNGVDFRLLLVGDGAVFDALKEQVSSFQLDDKVLLTGRVPHDEVEDYYSIIDIAPFPRKPWEVCELVSPLKPFEAMALQKAVVVSSTRALTEIVTDGYNGLVFEKGSVSSLQRVLQQLLDSPERQAKLGSKAREWIIKERSWDVAGKTCTSCYLSSTSE
ncbi:MAG: glycosyltransferase family 4 protein [Alkalimonas sp.]|nr:glycosyltransferase family 4 protein [Alkalimonas sp.]